MYPYWDIFPTQKSEDKHYLVESSLILSQKTSSIKIQDLLLRTCPSGFCYFNQDFLINFSLSPVELVQDFSDGSLLFFWVMGWGPVLSILLSYILAYFICILECSKGNRKTNHKIKKWYSLSPWMAPDTEKKHKNIFMLSLIRVRLCPYNPCSPLHSLSSLDHPFIFCSEKALQRVSFSRVTEQEQTISLKIKTENASVDLLAILTLTNNQVSMK